MTVVHHYSPPPPVRVYVAPSYNYGYYHTTTYSNTSSVGLVGFVAVVAFICIIICCIVCFGSNTTVDDGYYPEGDTVVVVDDGPAYGYGGQTEVVVV